MPVHSLHVVKAGTRNRSVFVRARDPSGLPRTGLRHDGPGASAAFVREGDRFARSIALSGPTTERRPGRFREVDPVLMPGVYELDLPDEVMATGSTRAMVVLTFADAVVDPMEFDLVAFDPQDPKCIGMSQLGDERRHQFLRQALPRLTERELEAGRRAEAELAGRATSERP